MAMRIAVEQIIELRYMLRMLGVPVEGPSWLFGDNESVVINSTIPSSTLKKRWNALSYHRVRESAASGIVNVVHMPGEYNPADTQRPPLWHRAQLQRSALGQDAHGQGDRGNPVPDGRCGFSRS